MDVKKLVYIAEYFSFSEDENNLKLNYFYSLVTEAKKKDIILNGYIDLDHYELIEDSLKHKKNRNDSLFILDTLYLNKIYPYSDTLENIPVPLEEKKRISQKTSDQLEFFKSVSLAKQYTFYLEGYDLFSFYLEGKIISYEENNQLVFLKNCQALADSQYAVDLETLKRYPLCSYLWKQEMKMGETYFVPTYPIFRPNLVGNQTCINQMIQAFEVLDCEQSHPIIQFSDYQYSKVKS